MKYLWMMASQDKYELPLAVTDTAAELARIAGVKVNTVICSAIRAARGERKHSKYVRVKVEEDQW